MKSASIIPALLPSRTEGSLVEVFELTEEEIALRHKLELKVERALYQAAVVLQALHDRPESSAHQYLNYGWRSEQKVARAFGEVEIALQELRTRRLHRSTHRDFNQYVSERFGCFISSIQS